MTDHAAALLALARDDLEVARRDLDGFPRHAASRAYYAVFHAVSAALSDSGHPAKSHAGARSMFGEVLVKSGPFDSTDVRTLARLTRLRNDADYHVGRNVSAQAATEAVQDAAQLVDRLAAWLVGGTFTEAS